MSKEFVLIEKRSKGNVPHLAVQGVSKEFVLIEKKELKKGSKEFVLIGNNDFYISIYNKESPSVWPHLAMRTNTVLTPCNENKHRTHTLRARCGTLPTAMHRLVI